MTAEEKAAIIEEAKKHEPDIWSDEYFPYWEKVYAQFEESEDKAMKKYELKKLSLEVKDIPDNTDITRFCVDRIDDCYIETIDSYDDKDDAYDALREYNEDVDRNGDVKIITTYIIESFEADEDGEFVEGSDYDWLESYYWLNTEYLYGDYSVPKCSIVRGKYDKYGDKDRDTEEVLEWTEYEDIGITVLSGEDFDPNDADEKTNSWIREKLYFLPDYEVN